MGKFVLIINIGNGTPWCMGIYDTFGGAYDVIERYVKRNRAQFTSPGLVLDDFEDVFPDLRTYSYIVKECRHSVTCHFYICFHANGGVNNAG